MSLVWREQLSVGNDSIDSDHKHLIEIVNLAEHSLLAKSRAELTSVLAQLLQYSKVHFSREEKFASAVGYPDVEVMHASHEALIEKLQQITQELDGNLKTSVVEGFVTFLREWLVNHVIKEDMLLKPYFVKRSPSFTPD